MISFPKPVIALTALGLALVLGSALMRVRTPNSASNPRSNHSSNSSNHPANHSSREPAGGVSARSSVCHPRAAPVLSQPAPAGSTVCPDHSRRPTAATAETDPVRHRHGRR